MQLSHLLCCANLLASWGLANASPSSRVLVLRQDGGSSAFPTLSTSGEISQSSSVTDTSRNSGSQTATATRSTSDGTSPSPSGSVVASASRNTNSTITSGSPSSTVSNAFASATATMAPNGNNTTNATSPAASPAEVLPLTPRITPALSIGGVVLILTGMVYALIGVKNRWVHVFLSTAYLASLAVLVLIVYVLIPPVSNAVQGAYFVGIFMSGLIFGGGALVFKEVTEGLGCLLGGFCLSMWFLTLKNGGLIPNTGAKAIFISVFCVVCWSLSFSHYTRAYALIGATSFSGATSFVLGIDCFSKGGLKEFWVYIWDLNDNLFPLNTDSYPITRGTRVETVIIVLGTIIGIISQVKLWRVIQNRQKQREAIQADDERRRDAVEEALGRHLQRQNDRDRSEWERRYGDRLNSKRETILWSEAHGENKRFSGISTADIDSSQNSASNDSLEMTQMPPAQSRPSLYSIKAKRHSNISVQPIQEVEEEDQIREKDVAKHDSVLAEIRLDDMVQSEQDKQGHDQTRSSSPFLKHEELFKSLSEEVETPIEHPQSLRPQHTKPSSRKTADRLHLGEDDARPKKRGTIPSLSDLKRRSINSLRSRKSLDGERSPTKEEFSESKEALVQTAGSRGTPSRASSVAATLDEENERLEMPPLETHDSWTDGRPPQIVISPVHDLRLASRLRGDFNGPPSPSGLSDSFESDPEALVRQGAGKAHGYEHNGEAQQGHGNPSLGDGPRSTADISQTSNAEGLTKGALERVPSQTSNVVLSYRTNEWAKHIATAEAPMFEEPDPIMIEDEEAPTHLAEPVPSSRTQSPIPESSVKPPPLPSPITSVAPSEAGVKVNPEVQSAEPVRSRPTSEITPASIVGEVSPNPIDVPSRTPSQMSTSTLYKRSFTDPAQPQPSVQSASALKMGPRVSNPISRSPSRLQNVTIDENAATDFKPRPAIPTRSLSSSGAWNSQQHLPLATPYIDTTRMSSTTQISHQPSAYVHNPTIIQHPNNSMPDIRPESGLSNYRQSTQSSAGMRSDTRLSDYGTRSHQPIHRNNTNDSRRENLMADWRMQLAQSNAKHVVPNTTVDNSYTQQRLSYEADKMRREQEKYTKQRREQAMDQTMRTQGMIDAHREVLKKMQSQANRKLTQ